MVQVAGFQEQNAAERLLGLHEGTIGDLDLAILQPERDCVTGRIERFSPECSKHATRVAAVEIVDPVADCYRGIEFHVDCFAGVAIHTQLIGHGSVASERRPP